MRASRAVGAAVFCLPMFTATASLAFTALTTSWWVGLPMLWQWWLCLWDMAVFPGPIPAADKLGLLAGLLAGGGLSGGALALAAAFPADGGNRRAPVQRAKTPTHGDADWATAKAAARRFPGADPDYGGVVVALNHRRDLSPERDLPFDPRDKTTWGGAPSAPALVDPCRMRSTHSIGVSGSGGGKSETIRTTLAHPAHRFRGSWVGSDPKGELEAQTRRTREAMGHRVFAIGTGKDGINIFDMLDPDSPDFSIDVQSQVSRMFAETNLGRDAEGEKWDTWGKAVVCALIADMLNDPAFPDADKNPRGLRAAIASGEEELRQVLTGIAEWSPSTYARQMARSVLLKAEETWSGIFASAQAGTLWLSNPALADMVSNRSFHPREICGGDITVFVQSSPKQLKEAPGATRSIYGTLMSAVYEAHGFAVRAFFDIDESYTIGRMGIFEIARDLGRSAGMTCRWWYQSLGQLLKLYGRDAVQEWQPSCAYFAFAGIADMATAQAVAQMCGQYGAVVQNTSTNTGTTTQNGLFAASWNKGQGTSESEVQRSLELAHDFIQKWADNEVLVLSRGMRPIRACLPLAFMMPEVEAVCDPNPIEAARDAWREENRARKAGLESEYRKMALAA